MRTVEIDDATAPLAEYARDLEQGPVVLTRNGRPAAALVSIAGADLETIALSTDAGFVGIVERSRARHAAEGGLAADEVRRQLGVEPKANRPHQKERSR